MSDNILTISQLPSKTSLLNTDKIAIDDGVHTYKVTGAQLREFLKINSAPMGTVSFSQSSKTADNPGRLPLFTGTTIPTANAIYPDFFAWVQSHPELCVSEENYEERLTQFGECPFYVINTTTGVLRLPLLKSFIKSANTDDGIKQTAAGLPNITSDPIVRGTWYGTGVDTGAIHTFNTPNVGGAEHNVGRGWDSSFQLDASWSNPIYGNSDTVTPQHTTLYPWVSVINYAVPASVAQNQALLDVLINGGHIGGGAPTITYYKNNTGTTVTIADTSAAALVKIYKNGLLLEPTEDYSISGTTLTMVTALVATDKITTEVF